MRVNLEVASTVIYIVPLELALLIVPVKVEELLKVKFKLDISSITISPSIFCPVTVIVTTPPLLPEVPHSSVPSISKNTPEPYLNVTFDNVIVASVFVTKNIGAVEYTDDEFLISIVESDAVKDPLPLSASPLSDWYIITPALSTLFLFPTPVHVKVDDFTTAEFLPSTTTIWAPSASPVDWSIVISPVEYMTGEPAPAVDNVHLVHETVPSPLSVASEAHDPPVVEIVTFVPVIVPP